MPAFMPVICHADRFKPSDADAIDVGAEMRAASAAAADATLPMKVAGGDAAGADE